MLNVREKPTYLVSEVLCVSRGNSSSFLGMVPDLKKFLVLRKNGPMRNKLEKMCS